MSQDLLYQLGLATSGIALVYLVLLRRHRSTALQLNGNPPGPKPWPFLGNVLDMPRTKEWQTFHQWTQKYGMFDIL
jgi:hypothetical protein